MEEAMGDMNAYADTTIVTVHLVALLQFLGFAGSCEDSHIT